MSKATQITLSVLGFAAVIVYFVWRSGFSNAPTHLFLIEYIGGGILAAASIISFARGLARD